MAFEIVNVGAAANDHTGDTLRAAMQKMNTNWALLPPQRGDGDPVTLGKVGRYDWDPYIDTLNNGIWHWDATLTLWRNL